MEGHCRADTVIVDRVVTGQRWLPAGPWAPAAGTITAALLWLPWWRTGTTRRSAFRLAGALRDAGLLTRSPARAFVVAVALVPGLAAGAWLLWFTGFRRAAAAATIAAGGLVSGCAIGIRHVGGAHVAPAVTLAAATGIVAAGIALAGLVAGLPHREVHE